MTNKVQTYLTPFVDESTEWSELGLFSEDYFEMVLKLFNWQEDHSKNFAHILLGITTEFEEARTATDATNATEEVGDLLFYMCALLWMPEMLDDDPAYTHNYGEAMDAVAGYLQQMEARTQEAYKVGAQAVSEMQVGQMALTQDVCKRWLGYGHEPEENFTPAAGNLIAAVCLALSGVAKMQHKEVGEVMKEALAANQRKLSKRYGDQFDAEKARNRDLSAERKALEGEE